MTAVHEPADEYPSDAVARALAPVLGVFAPGMGWREAESSFPDGESSYPPPCSAAAAARDAFAALPPPAFVPPVLGGVPVPPFMSTDSAVRKLMPVASGFANYFPDAMLLGSWVSRVGNDKHNPGQPLHWAKEKSADEPDAELRHMLDAARGTHPDPGLEPLAHLGHLASKFWRAAADLQRACDAARAAFERGEEWRK